ncbi:RNA polymerase sigma factor [Bacteroidota bacterium]
MYNYTTSEILEGIKKHDSNVLNFIYNKYYNEIRQFIIKNSGEEEDAKDVFQESIIVLYRQLKKKSLELTCTINTYLFSICKYIWFKQLKKRKPNLNSDYNLDEILEYDDEFEVVVADNEKFELYQCYFKKLPEDCQKVLQLYIENKSIKEIAQEMGFTENYAKKRKFTCKEFLVKNIKNDPKFKELQ